MLRFADTERELEKALNATETVFNKNNMEINIEKTKVIACRIKSGKKRLNIQKGNEKIGESSEFCYLGSKITRGGRCNADIRSRIEQAKKAFAKILQLLVSNIDLEIRKKLLKTYVWSVELYGCEARTIGKGERKRLEAFEMWFYRKLFKIGWVDEIANSAKEKGDKN